MAKTIDFYFTPISPWTYLGMPRFRALAAKHGAAVNYKPVDMGPLFASAGVTGSKKEVSYCEVGLQASYTYFLARYLGIDAAMYDGSYNEWSSAKQPVVRGDSPR